MEYEEDEKREGSVLERIKESPRTVSALIIILIVVAAIYAFSGDQQNADELGGNNEEQTSEEGATNEQGDEAQNQDEEGQVAGEQASESPAVTPVPSAQPVTQEQLSEQAKQLPEPRKVDSGYIEVAQAGEGITHQARKATTRYLSENNVGFNVTNEHRIYIEDYLQNRLGTQPLQLGAEQMISYDLIKEAVSAAQQLNESQLKNLSQYTYALSS